LKEVSNAFSQKDYEMRHQSLFLLKYLIRKHDLDPRVIYRNVLHLIILVSKSRTQRKNCGDLLPTHIDCNYFTQFIVTRYQLLHYSADIHKFESEERRQWLHLFLWVTKQCPRALLRDYWAKETIPRRLQFMFLLSLSVECFEVIIGNATI
jgi:hypothetical protein